MSAKKLSAGAIGAWLLVAIYYFYQYALRSAPSVMMPELTKAFAVDALGVSAIVGMFYYGYSPFSLVAGAALDRFGAKRIIPIGAALVGVGAMLFGSGDVVAANIGRFLQGAGGAFALVGAAYLVNKNFPASMAASFIGATQMFGMAGGSAGQFFVGPMIKGGLPWGQFWLYTGVLGLVIAVCLFAAYCGRRSQPLPTRRKRADSPAYSARSRPFLSIRSPSSAGSSRACSSFPTTILAMTWGVRFLQDARGREYDAAVTLAATVPLGWMIGCPLLGFISDRLGRRKPVILAGSLGPAVRGARLQVFFGDPTVFRGAPVGILMGILSGAAMLPYTVIKEANPPELGGSATGVINFLNFTFSALLGPVFGSRLAKRTQATGDLSLEHYQAGFRPLLYGVALAFVLACLLRETGPAARKALTPAPRNTPGTKDKPPLGQGLASSEADGTRTRNHRIDSPVL